MNHRIIAATATAVVLLTASGSAAVAGVIPPGPGRYGQHGYTCLAQMHTLRVVSSEAGITIGSAFIGRAPTRSARTFGTASYGRPGYSPPPAPSPSSHSTYRPIRRSYGS